MSQFKRLIGLAVLFFVLKAGTLALAFSATDANSVFSAYNSDFYMQNGTNGYFKNNQSGGVDYFWSQAEEIECVIDAYEWTSNSVYQGMITNLLNGFITDNGSSWYANNGYNDDNMWAVIAFARGGLDTGMTNYCNLAKADFDAVYARAWSTNLGGGLYWQYPENAGKNACVNGPGAIAAYLLYQIYGDTNYWNKATNMYYWERSVLFNAGTGAIYDNISTNGAVDTWSSTYNQGTFIGAANFLGQTNDATLAAAYTMASMTGGGVLPEYGIAGNNSGFNAIFLRWMVRYMRSHSLQSAYEPWLQANATAAWNMRRTADNLSWCQWLQTSPAGTNFYSWDCISSLEALQAANPTQIDPPLTVPTGYSGYWPLDTTSGSSAVDVSGNGNNGVVSGATWNANGRANGCLIFNGINNYVRVTNLVCNDFSIAFWVKTSQTAGTGQWYKGAGLVDGDFPGPANDFGTALCGGKFAFGVGNPDTTILSTSSIDDGAWHLCVATRQQATGAMCVYVDGNLQATGIGSRNTLNASAQLLFGAIASGGGYFNGSLDEVKIFSRALGSNEVAALYGNLVSAPSTAPAGLTAAAGNAQVQLSWWKGAVASSYNLKRSLISGGPYITITNVTGTSYTDTNVVNNRTYFYVVSVVNTAGEGTNSAEASASPAGVAAWFRADAITGLASGAAVSTWNDVSGNGDDAIQTVNANQPVYVTNAINGQPVVRFNGASHNCLWLNRPVQDNFTMILVFQSSQSNQGNGTAFYNGAALINGDQPRTANDFGAALNSNGQVMAGTGNPDTSINSGNGFNNGQPHLVTFTRTEGTGALVLYVDGNQVASGTGGTNSLTAPGTLVLGEAGADNTGYLTGDIAEVQIYNTVLSLSDRLSQEKALKCKYGLSGGAAPFVPTQLTGAAGNRQVSLDWLLTTGASSYNLWRSTNNGASYMLVTGSLTNSSYVDTSAVSGQTNFYKIAATDDCGASANSPAVGVYLPLPGLVMSAGANALVINWPSWANDWTLYGATNLASPAAWTPVTNGSVLSNGVLNVTLPIGSGTRFFRLAAPAQ